MKIYYKSSSGRIIDFMGSTYGLKDSDLLEHEWAYTGTENTGSKSGGDITGFRKKIAKTSLTFDIHALSSEEYLQALEDFLSITESDVLNQTPGRLYVDEYYYPCYIYASSKKEFGYMSTFLENTAKIVSPYPLWCRDVTKSFLKGNPMSCQSEEEFLFYPFGYPYQYSMPRDAGFLDNDHYAPCDFQLIIYGPCENPAIRVNGHLYEITATLYAGDYLKADSRDNTVFLYKSGGRKVNLFNWRNKDSGLFEKIPAGRSSVTWNTAAFGFDLTVFQERSVPKWIL